MLSDLLLMLVQVCLEEMPQHVKTFQSFQNMDEFGNMMVPTDKMDEIKRRWECPSRVWAFYQAGCMEYAAHMEKKKTLLFGVFSLTGKHAQLLVIAVSFLCLQLHSLVCRRPPSGLPASEWRLNTTGSSWTTGSSATQFWICWGRSRPSCVSGGDLPSHQRLSGCCCKSGRWAATQPHATLWPQTLAREDNTCKEIFMCFQRTRALLINTFCGRCRLCCL